MPTIAQDAPRTLDHKVRLALGGAGYVPLDAADERELARRIAGGDAESAWALALANHNFVRLVAQRYHRDDVEMDDLVAEGVLGLVQAAERFDAERGLKFITYGIWWIRRAILRYLRTFEHAVHVPKYKQYEIQQLRRTTSELAQGLGRSPSIEELCSASGKAAGEVSELLNLMHAASAIDSQDETSAAATIATDEDAEESVVRADAWERTSELLPLLTERERLVLDERFGLSGSEPTTLAEVGQRVGLTKERVRQIEKGACARLRAALEDPRLPRALGRRRVDGAPLQAA